MSDYFTLNIGRRARIVKCRKVTVVISLVIHTPFNLLLLTDNVEEYIHFDSKNCSCTDWISSGNMTRANVSKEEHIIYCECTKRREGGGGGGQIVTVPSPRPSSELGAKGIFGSLLSITVLGHGLEIIAYTKRTGGDSQHPARVRPDIERRFSAKTAGSHCHPPSAIGTWRVSAWRRFPETEIPKRARLSGSMISAWTPKFFARQLRTSGHGIRQYGAFTLEADPQPRSESACFQAQSGWDRAVGTRFCQPLQDRFIFTAELLRDSFPRIVSARK